MARFSLRSVMSRVWCLLLVLSLPATTIATFDRSGRFHTLPDEVLLRARGFDTNTILEDSSVQFNCGDSNGASDLRCTDKDLAGDYRNLNLDCVICSASVQPWSSSVTSGVTTPFGMMNDPNATNVSCGTKSKGLCDGKGNCTDIKSDPTDPNCGANATRMISQEDGTDEPLVPLLGTVTVDTITTESTAADASSNLQP